MEFSQRIPLVILMLRPLAPADNSNRHNTSCEWLHFISKQVFNCQYRSQYQSDNQRANQSDNQSDNQSANQSDNQSDNAKR